MAGIQIQNDVIEKTKAPKNGIVLTSRDIAIKLASKTPAAKELNPTVLNEESAVIDTTDVEQIIPGIENLQDLNEFINTLPLSSLLVAVAKRSSELTEAGVIAKIEEAKKSVESPTPTEDNAL